MDSLIVPERIEKRDPRHVDFRDLEPRKRHEECRTHGNGCFLTCPYDDCDGAMIVRSVTHGPTTEAAFPCPWCQPDYVYPEDRAMKQRAKEQATEKHAEEKKRKLWGPK